MVAGTVSNVGGVPEAWPAITLAMGDESETGIDKGASVLAPDNVGFSAIFE